MMKNYFMYGVLFLLFGSWITIPAVVIYWYNETVPTTYINREVLTPKVAPGEALRIRIETGEFRSRCSAKVFRSIVDAAGTIHSVITEGRPERTFYTIDVTVPLGAAPGGALYRATVEWVCNPVQEIFPLTIQQQDLPFEIVPIEGQMQLPDQQGIYQIPMKKSEIARRSQ